MASSSISNSEELINFIAERTKEEWAAKQRPYLLSYIPPELIVKKVDYRDIIGPQTLKQFVSNLSDKVILVQHPTQKPKIGLIPKGETYSFEEKGGQANSYTDRTEPVQKSRHPKYAVLNFLEALSRLDEKEIEKVDIPLSVLVRIVGGK